MSTINYFELLDSSVCSIAAGPCAPSPLTMTFVVLLFVILAATTYAVYPRRSRQLDMDLLTPVDTGVLWLIAISASLFAWALYENWATFNVTLELVRLISLGRHALGDLFVPIVVGYPVIGTVWAIVYFWLYARRLGQCYVQERDGWLSRHAYQRIEDIPAERHDEFKTDVLGVVQSKMIYQVDFPLRTLQQKRFFVGNFMWWPVTIAVYLLSDLVTDMARTIWFALREVIHRHWVTGMPQYLEDDAYCQKLVASQGKEARA